jgi:hypothetical protein
MKRLLALLLSLLLAQAGAGMALGEAFLSGDDLQSLQPAYEAFLQALADALIEKDLLPETDRASWILYQLGDFVQNGGSGSIAVLYTPGLLSMADESVSARRMTAEIPVGVVHLETLRRYAEQHSPLPGLPLDTELVDENGIPVPCRFRWSASGGSFLVWDGALGFVVDVGIAYTNDDKPLYWYAEPAAGVDETLTLELLHPELDEAIGQVTLLVLSSENFWAPEVLK